MDYIKIDDKLFLKKIDPNNEKDIWLAKELDKDELVAGRDGFLYSIEEHVGYARYLKRQDMYGSSYAIYYGEEPIGYLGLSDLDFTLKYIEVASALLKSERGKGIATTVLKKVTEIILDDKINDINKVVIFVDKDNNKAQAVADRSGFINESTQDGVYITYQKTKEMLYKERHML